MIEWQAMYIYIIISPNKNPIDYYSSIPRVSA